MGTVGDCMELLLRPRLPALDELSDLGLPAPTLLIDGSLLLFFAGDGADSISASSEGLLTPLEFNQIKQSDITNIGSIELEIL